MFAGILFFVFLSMTYVYYQDFFENLNSNDELTLLSSSARDICMYTRNLLTNSSNNQLDSNQLINLTNSNYISIKENLNLDTINFNILLLDPLTNTSNLNFGFKSPKSSLSSYYSCYISNSNILNQISVEVWK
jgi:hypothetical protein